MDKKGQAFVEFLLVIVMILPLVLMLTNTVKNEVIPKIDAWFETEIQTQVRYGYSYSYFEEAGIQPELLANTSGATPIKYQTGDKFHPLGKVVFNWEKK